LAGRRSLGERFRRAGIHFHGRAQELYQASGATAAHISIAHTTEHAIAEVILEKN
jgi:holo-[acyl-carrier protein] synthase